jgi:hypothetical protein
MENDIKAGNHFWVTCDKELKATVSTPDGPFYVDLKKRTCSCGVFQDMLKPCEHACAVIRWLRTKHGMEVDYVDYVAPHYKLLSQLRIYSNPCSVVDISNLQPDANVQPLPAKPSRGRPKKARFPLRGEATNAKSAKAPPRCNKCKEAHATKDCGKAPDHLPTVFGPVYHNPAYHDYPAPQLPAANSAAPSIPLPLTPSNPSATTFSIPSMYSAYSAPTATAATSSYPLTPSHTPFWTLETAAALMECDNDKEGAMETQVLAMDSDFSDDEELEEASSFVDGEFLGSITQV